MRVLISGPAIRFSDLRDPSPARDGRRRASARPARSPGAAFQVPASGVRGPSAAEPAAGAVAVWGRLGTRFFTPPFPQQPEMVPLTVRFKPPRADYFRLRGQRRRPPVIIGA